MWVCWTPQLSYCPFALLMTLENKDRQNKHQIQWRASLVPVAITTAEGVGYVYVCLFIGIGKNLHVYVLRHLFIALLCTQCGCRLLPAPVPALKQRKDA